MEIPCRISPDKRSMVVLEDTHVEWEYQGITYRRTLPEGHEFRPGAWLFVVLFLAAILQPLALWQASALHDFLYDEIEDNPKSAVPRVVADAALKADDTDPEWLRELAWRFVRVIGFMPWLGGTR